MKNKKRILIIELVLVCAFLLVGVTYSLFNSNTEISSTPTEIAQFIFNTNKVDVIELPLQNLVPNDNFDYEFSVANNLESKVSDITVEYQITLKTLHLIPLRYELTLLGATETVVLSCDETTVRNSDNILECKTPVLQMNHDTSIIDNYKLNVTFPVTFNDSVYANLVDYVDIEIDSWQKVD